MPEARGHRRTWAIALLAAAAALAAGCASTPSPGTRAGKAVAALPASLPTPAGSAQVQPGLAIERWWLLFDDATLTQLIDDALRDNHELAAAAARVRAARAQLDEQRGAQRPAIELQAGSRRVRQNDAIGNEHSVSIAGRYELDLWGRLAAGSEASRQRLLSQQWAQAALQWSLSAQIAEAWFTLRAVQRQIEISEAVQASRSQALALRRREQAAGAGSEFDLRRAEAELAGSDSTLAALRRQRATLAASLALLAGRSGDALLRPALEQGGAVAALDPAQPFAARLPEGLGAQRLLDRPDVRQAETTLAAAEADIAAARAALLPAFALSGSAGSDARSLSKLFDGPSLVWSLAAGMTQSIFDGGRLRAQVGAADARADEQLARYAQVIAGALRDVHDAYAELEASEQAQQAETRRVAALARARALAQTGWRAGANGYLDLLDAERNHHQAQLDEVAAYRDRLIGQVAAFKALGGGYSTPPAL